MHPTVTIDSTPARIGTYISAAIAVFVSGLIIWSDGPLLALYSLPYVWLVFLVVYMLWWMPRIVLSEDMIYVRNMLFSWQIPWVQYTGARLNLGLILETREVDIRASAARPRTGLKNITTKPGPLPVPHFDESANHIRLDLDSTQALALLRDFHERHIDAGLGKLDRHVVKKLNYGPLLVALVLLLFTFLPNLGIF